MARDAADDPEQLERDGRLAGSHRVVVADREDRDVRRVDAADERHVAEDVRVAGEVELEPVFELDDEPGRLTCVRPVGDARGVVGIRQRDVDAVEGTVPPLFGPWRGFASTPLFESHPRSSTRATTGQPNFSWIGTVSPRWSPCPCVRRMASQRSGSSSDSGSSGSRSARGRRRSASRPACRPGTTRVRARSAPSPPRKA